MHPPRALISVVALALVLALAASSPMSIAGEPTPPSFRIIVHPKNSVARLERRFLADAFFKNVTRWPDGSLIRPVDLQPREPVRSAFSQRVLERSVRAVKAYWHQRIFAGRGVPPPELARDADVMAFVLQHEGAIGYVSSSFDASSAKTVALSP
jgi:ABC-type phosphate transport system substrate-binding protein